MAEALYGHQAVWLAQTKVQGKKNSQVDDRQQIFHKSYQEPIYVRRNKHIEIKFHFMWNKVQNGVLEVVHYFTHKQLVDMMTNTIKTKHFINFKDGIGVVDFNLNFI